VRPAKIPLNMPYTVAMTVTKVALDLSSGWIARLAL
jgi:hypothetical protein